jgi:hypothetical protein
VIATKSKLDRLKSLRVDTGDVLLDEELKMRMLSVVADYKTTLEMTVE